MYDKDYKPYTATRWTEIPGFRVLEDAEPVGYPTEHDEEFHNWLLKNGYIKEDTDKSGEE